MVSRTGRPSRLEALSLGLVATGAVSIGAAVIVGAVTAGVEIFASPVAVSLPVHDAPMASLADASGVAAAEYTRSLVSLEALDAGIRWLLLLEVALPAVATVIVCASLWWLGFSLITQRAFRRSMVPMLVTASFGLIVAGMLAPMFGAFARAEMVAQLPLGDTDEFWTLLYELNPAPIGWGIALALVATAFEVGQRLQRETEGLV